MKKNLLILALFALSMMQGMAQKTFGNIPDLHVEGKWLVDEHGNKVVLHGVMDTPSPWFNNNRWGSVCNGSTANSCVSYFNTLFNGLANPSKGTYCNVFRLHLDCCWTNNNSVNYSYVNDKGETIKVGRTGDGEADIQHFDKSRLETYLGSVYTRIAKSAMAHGMYVVMRPPGVCPGDIYVNGDYQHYLMDVWDIVTKNDTVLKYPGQISIELANEPVRIKDANGQNENTGKTMHDFFQPIVDKIRANGFTGIIWVPGGIWQQEYKGYATNPITGYNIGYAVHDYVGWFNTSDSHYDTNATISAFQGSVPVVNTNPIIITEVDWSPESKSNGHYNESGTWVAGNYGTWATGSTSKWGKAYKGMLDHFGNISMTLSGTATYIDIDKWRNNKVLQPAFLDAMVADGFEDAYEASSGACWIWYKDYAADNTRRPYMAETRKWSADQGNGTYINPIINADFPDPDVIRVNDTYYMVSTTMYLFPGATILKSKDLVNWEYCSNPLQKINDTDNYNLKNGLNHYAQGQWAASLNYSKGKFYLYFISYGKEDEGKNILLTTTDPEGTWDMQYWPEHYYDSGWLFDDGPDGDGYVYVACGIGDIYVNKLDAKSLKKLSSTKVLSHDTKDYYNSMEGSHMYHIGDFYYLYLTTGGYYRGQQIWRSKNPMGPYEECPYMVFENQSIHQGALVETQTGEWWTILFKDAGSIGRVPYLEPVTWTDGWPVIGNKGIDVSKNKRAYKKPNVGQSYPRTYLPTNDTFTDPELGKQWEWNHNPDNNAWSLYEKPGFLRLHTASVANSLDKARNSLTQRIFGYSPEGTLASRQYTSYGTIKMAINNMIEGDVAGLAVFQEPMSYIGVKVIDGKKHLYSQKQDKIGGTPTEIIGDVIEADTIYLRAKVNFGSNKCVYAYSLDNQKYTSFGHEMQMQFTLGAFVGNRFYIFNYGTKQLGGFVDIDWFSTEPVFAEEWFYGPGVLNTFTEEDLTMVDLQLATTSYSMTPASAIQLKIMCTSESGVESNVAANCTFDVSNPEVAGVSGGRIVSVSEGTTDITATYTDPFGNSRSVSFTVNVTYFPLTADAFNPSLLGTGKFIEKTKAVTTAKNGLGGWTYTNGLDLSAYNYLVVKLRIASSTKPEFRIYDNPDASGECYAQKFGSSKKIAIDLKNMTTASGKKVDPTKIYIAGISSNGSGSVYIDEIYLSMDGETNAIEDIISDNAIFTKEEIFDINGRRISQMQRGINVIRQTRSDGSVTTKKVFVK